MVEHVGGGLRYLSRGPWYHTFGSGKPRIPHLSVYSLDQFWELNTAHRQCLLRHRLVAGDRESGLQRGCIVFLLPLLGLPADARLRDRKDPVVKEQ